MWHSDKYVVVQNRRDPNKDHNENQYSQLKVIDRNTGAIVSTVLNQYGSHDWNFGNSVVVIGDYVIVGAAGDQNPTQNVTGTGGSFKNSVYSALDGSFLYDIDSTERLNLVHKNSDTVNATVQITTTTRKEIEVKFNSQVDVTISADTDVMATRAFAESAVAGVDLTNYSNTTAMNTAIATAKSEAISAAATDATTKADAAEAAAISAANTAVANAIDAAPDSLNTLNELAAALGDDANFASTMTTALAGKADASALADKADASAVATSAQGALADTAVQPEDFGTGITLGAGVSDWASAELSSPINIGTQYNVGWTYQPIATSEIYFVTGSRGSASNGSIDLLVWSKSDTSSPYRDLSSALPANAYNTLYLEMTDEYVFISFNTNNGNGDTGVLMIKISDLTVVDIKSIATSGGASWTTGGQGHGFTFDIDDQYIAMAPRLGSNEAIIVDWVSQQYVRSYAFTDGQDMLSVAVDSGKLLVSSVRDAAAGKYQTTTADLVDIATGSLLHKFTAQQTLQHQVNPNAYGSAYGDIVLMSSQYIAVGSTNGTDPATGYITGAIDIFNASTYAFMGTITQDDGMTNHWANDGIGESGKVDLFGQYLVATKTAPSDVLYVYDLSSATFTTAIKEIALSDKQGGRVVLSSTGAVIMPEHGIKATSDGAMSIVTVPVSTTSPFIVDDTVFATRTFAESAVAGVDLTNYSNTTAMNTAIATAKSEAISAAATDATTKADAAEAAAIAAANTAATTAVADVVDAAPEALNTLNELAAALGDDANFASTVTTSLAAKADSSALDAAVADIATKADTNAVATLAQGALADTAIQPEDLSTGITTASSTSVNIGTLNYEEFDSGSEHGEFINSGAPAIGGNYLYVIDFWNNGNIDNLYRKTIESDGTLSSGFTPWSGNITGYLPDYAQLRNSINKRFAASDDGYLIIGDPLSNNYSGEMFYLKFDDVWMNGAAGSLDLSFGHGGDRVGESVDISSYGYAYTSRTQDDGYYVYVNTRLPNQSSTTGSYRLSGTDLSLIKIGQMGLKVTDDKVIFSSGNGRPTAYQIHNLIDGTYAATINESGDSGWGWRMDTDGTNILITSDNYVYVYDMTGALVTSFVHNISFPYGMGGVTIN